MLRNIIKDTIDKSIEEKIPADLAKLIENMKAEHKSEMQSVREELDKMTEERTVLKKLINEQSKCMGPSKEIQ